MPGPVRFDSLSAWLDWQLTLHPQPIEPGLERVARVARRSGWSPPRCPVITIGGTNGKGSCVALADAILREEGYRTATFTSPHLVDYAERIRLRGHPVSAASLVAAFERIADALGPDTLTFFEFNTLAALLIFDSAGPDAVILEVGMGGRLDAVNIVDADVAVVVSLGIDHAEWLGADLETIAREKAGIFRAGRPAVFGGDEAPPGSLIEAAHAEGALLRLRGRDFREIPRPGGRWDLILGTGIAAERLADLPVPALAGTAQLGNSATTIAALRELRPRLPVTRDAIVRGLERVTLPGRFERIADRELEWVLDVAHNPAAARVLAASLRATRGRGRTTAVCGMLADKDVPAVVAELRGCVDTWIAASTEGPRGLDDTELARRARFVEVDMHPGGTVAEAMRFARSRAGAGDRIVVFGSFHTVGPALEELARAGLAARHA
jgi:dihydrofolate synthase / folylpolyglutamate synthase